MNIPYAEAFPFIPNIFIDVSITYRKTWKIRRIIGIGP